MDREWGSNCDVGGSFVSNGHNVIGALGLSNSGWTTTDALWVSDAKLAPLGNYGGATQTMALLPGSIAINGGASGTGVPTTDERGRARIGAVDIGAFESQGYHLVASSGGGQTAYAGLNVAKPIVVQFLENTTNAAIPGVTIAVAAPATTTAAQIPGALTATTDASGDASFTITANSLDGAYTISASAPAVPTAAPVTFALSNVAPQHSLTAPSGTDGRLATNLRGAVIAFNNDPGTADDTIHLNAGTYTLSLTSAPDDAGSGDLDILANNGGLTPTMLLLAGSPAIDKGSNALAVDASGKPLVTDQRGSPRISGLSVDIGAVE